MWRLFNVEFTESVRKELFELLRSEYPRVLEKTNYHADYGTWWKFAHLSPGQFERMQEIYNDKLGELYGSQTPGYRWKVSDKTTTTGRAVSAWAQKTDRSVLKAPAAQAGQRLADKTVVILPDDSPLKGQKFVGKVSAMRGGQWVSFKEEIFEKNT